MLCTSGSVDDVMCHIMKRMGKNQRRRACFVQFASWRLRGGVCRPLLLLITGPPVGPVLFCSLVSVGVCRLSLSSVVVCNAAHMHRNSPGAARGRPVVLRPVRATPCFFAVVAALGLGEPELPVQCSYSNTTNRLFTYCTLPGVCTP